MKWSLEASTMAETIKWRQGSALLAQERIGQSRSLPLANDHWKLEAARMFETSLARIQFDAWAIASGEGSEFKDFVEVTPDEGRGQLCSLYKINSPFHSNINLFALGGIIGGVAIVFILSIEVRSVGILCGLLSPCCGSLGMYTGARRDTEPLIADIIVSGLFYIMSLLLRQVFRATRYLSHCLASCTSA